MSDLDGYTKLLREQSALTSRRMDLQQQVQKSQSVFKDAIQSERTLIAMRLLKFYEDGRLTIEDIARATGVSMSTMFDLIREKEGEA